MRIFSLILLVGTHSNFAVAQLFLIESMLLGLHTRRTEHEITTENRVETFHHAHHHGQNCVCTPSNLCETLAQAHGGDERIDNNNMRKVSPCQNYLDVCCYDTMITSTENYTSISTENIGNNTFLDLEKENSKPLIDQQIDSTTKHPLTHTNQPFIDQDIEVTTYQPNSDKENEGYTNQPIISQEKENNTKQPFIDYTSTPDQLITPEDLVITTPTEDNFNTSNNLKCGTWYKNGIDSKALHTMDGKSQYGEFPSMVAIFIKKVLENGEKKLSYHCGGSLIDKNVVLTAAHCVIQKNLSTLVIRAGDWDLQTENEVFAHQDRNVKKIVTHPKYNSGALYNDVALIFVEEQFSLQENIKLMCLPTSDDTFTDKRCFTSSWVETIQLNNNNSTLEKPKPENIGVIGQYSASILKKLELPIIDRVKCAKALRTTRLGPKFMLHDSFLCAGGEEGKDTCKGNGGSPLMCSNEQDPNYLVQIGIVSWGIECGLADIPGVYVNVANYANWIEDEMKKNE